jgi:DNA-binding transcriptional ArsR family regulator
VSRRGNSTALLTTEALRFIRIERRLRERGANFEQLRSCVRGVSDATLKRDLQALRDEFGAPIAWDASRRVYHLAGEWTGMGAFLQTEATA